jgi:hypothetical protein
LLVKCVLCLVAAFSIVTAVPGVSSADDAREAKPRFKGVELYSWKDSAGDWVFVLLDGTNREKTAEEVKAARNKIKGAEVLKKAIARLAEGEQVSWSQRIKGFEFPPAATRKGIKKAAESAKVDLTIAGDE